MRLDKITTNFLKCIECNIEKSIDEFDKYKQRSATCIKKRCIECILAKLKNYKKQHYQQNIEKYKLNHARYRETHAEELKEYFKQRNINDKESLRQYRKNWYQKNKKDINKKSLDKRKSDIKTKIAHSLRNRILKTLKGTSKSAPTLELLGCSLEEFKRHLENKFRDGMSWQNHGSVWHIDHIMPCAKFDLTIEENQKKCFHYTNLQPLLAEENLSKGKKILT